MKFSELTLGQTASKTIHITPEMLASFADVTGDHNPLHTDPAYAEPRFGGVIAHGGLASWFFLGGACVPVARAGFGGAIAERALQGSGASGG